MRSTIVCPLRPGAPATTLWLPSAEYTPTRSNKFHTLRYPYKTVTTSATREIASSFGFVHLLNRPTYWCYELHYTRSRYVLLGGPNLTESDTVLPLGRDGHITNQRHSLMSSGHMQTASYSPTGSAADLLISVCETKWRGTQRAVRPGTCMVGYYITSLWGRRQLLVHRLSHDECESIAYICCLYTSCVSISSRTWTVFVIQHIVNIECRNYCDQWSTDQRRGIITSRQSATNSTSLRSSFDV